MVGVITSSQIDVWLANLDRADTTRAKALQILRSVLDLARRDRAIAYNPAADVKPPPAEPDRVGKALSDSEVTSILDAAEHVDETTAGIVWVMARAGLRIGEAIALQRQDIDLEKGVLHVRRSVNRRGEVAGVKHRKREDQGRSIPIPADLTERLRRHLRTSSVASLDGWVFTAPMGGLLHYGNWRRRVWNPTIELAGVEANPHDLRHTAITRLILVDRWSPAEVQRFAGHRDPRVTLAIYTHLSASDLPTPSTMTAT